MPGRKRAQASELSQLVPHTMVISPYRFRATHMPCGREVIKGRPYCDNCNKEIRYVALGYTCQSSDIDERHAHEHLETYGVKNGRFIGYTRAKRPGEIVPNSPPLSLRALLGR